MITTADELFNKSILTTKGGTNGKGKGKKKRKHCRIYSRKDKTTVNTPGIQ